MKRIDWEWYILFLLSCVGVAFSAEPRPNTPKSALRSDEHKFVYELDNNDVATRLERAIAMAERTDHALTKKFLAQQILPLFRELTKKMAKEKQGATAQERLALDRQIVRVSAARTKIETWLLYKGP